MPSSALGEWHSQQLARLGDLEALHARATGTGRGRRWGTDQFNGQLFVALVGQFQGFARALHDDALDWLRAQGSVARVLADAAAIGRQLDRGNPHISALGSDYAKIGLRVADEVKKRPHGVRRLHRLDRAVKLRNGIAHDDANQLALAAAGPSADQAAPTLDSYRVHRSAINGLAGDLDAVVGSHLGSLLGVTPPW